VVWKDLHAPADREKEDDDDNNPSEVTTQLPFQLDDDDDP
jgi:hypothetical protein